jgi:gamma-glutamyl-gamma-aminobutyrate hydrolase PuuD/uncharacterized protein YjbI with pentapeptide repeats
MIGDYFKVFFQFDANSTGLRIIKLIEEKEDKIKRLFLATIPLIDMHQPAGEILHYAFVAHQLKILIFKTASDYYLKREELPGNVSKIAIIVSKTALSLLLPVVHRVISNTYECAIHLQKFSELLKEKNYKDASYEFFSITRELAGIGLLVYGGPELLVISLLSQAAKELMNSQIEFSQGRYLEGIVNLACAGIRINAAKPHCQAFYRNIFGNEITQNDLDALFEEILQMQKLPEFKEQLIDFNALLDKYNFKCKIQGLSFQEKKISNVGFNNITFQDSFFKDTYIEFSSFKNVVFNRCDFFQAGMLISIFEKSHFFNCRLERTEFNWSQFSRSSFHFSDLTAAIFNDANFKSVLFSFCNMEESTFYDTEVGFSCFLGSNLKNTLFFDVKDKFFMLGNTLNEITKPIIGLLYNFYRQSSFVKAMDESVKLSQGIVFRLHCLPKCIDTRALVKEVEQKIQEYHSDPPNKDLPIPQFIMKDPSHGSEISKIKALNAKAAQYFDGFVLPGGADIEPEFYGAIKEEKTRTHSHPLRSIFDFAMIELVKSKNIPTLGICRGFQEWLVYEGSTLQQDDPAHLDAYHLMKITSETLEKNTEKYAFDILKGRFIIGVSKHHQRGKDISKDLDVIIEFAGGPELVITKFSDAEEYPKAVLVQFHPEAPRIDIYKSLDFFKNNINFFNNLVERAHIYNRKHKFHENENLA